MESPKDPPQINTPVIDLEELERIGADLGGLPQLDLSKEDERARKAIEEFEQTLKEQPPG
jgi:hypothetical protein